MQIDSVWLSETELNREIKEQINRTKHTSSFQLLFLAEQYVMLDFLLPDIVFHNRETV